MSKITNPRKQIKKRKTVKGVLNEVRRVLSDFDNWVQQDWEEQKEDGSFCYCLNGAIDAASASPDLAAEVKRVVDENIPVRFRERWAKRIKEWVLYPDSPQLVVEDESAISVESPIIALNDGTFHKRPRNAWKAILSVVDKARGA